MRKSFLLPLALGLCLLYGCGGPHTGKLSREDLPDVPVENIVAINVESDKGNIHIVPSSGKIIQMEAEYAITAPERSRRTLIEQNVRVTTDNSDPSLLSIYSEPGQSLTLKEGEDVSVDLTIKVPDGIGSVVVQSGSGDILVEKMDCAFSIISNNGSVTVKKSSFSGKSSITSLVGDIDVQLNNIAAAEEIRLSSDVGNIKFKIPRSSSYNLVMEELGQQGIPFKNKDEKTKINLSTKVGSIDFKK
ncbi:MAG: hypothetical protein DBX66_04600 [Clostridiales bacterium]|uniref:Adhesin n=1 Tax=Harryflintia acetispora TaxID=1849041 RepID=A0A9X8UHW8_9FIRM|nr:MULTISPECIES: DUF4097 family beta strand repeat-containing protein [Oscillospiraceae]PWM37890.1 MAG: hypothetical protein DBX66_04600 [Clostridiales bacterium]RGB66714.1 hypothetical protein DW086_07905 [Harryflintia acetispora]TCL42456.1 hypothetical protein EDD78_11082 [Harryflintia acetispora]